MINLVGAYIITILIAGLWIQGPKFSYFSEIFDKLPKIGHYFVIAFLFLIAYQSLYVEEYNSLLHIPVFLINGMNFWIHEAGHAYCMFFGETLHVFGGSFMQLAIPAGLFIRARRRKYTFLSAILLFWFGQNMPDVGRYIADAGARLLPLAGDGTHDWYFLLQKYGLLNYDTKIGAFVTGCGVIVMLCGIIYYILIFTQPKKEALNSVYLPGKG